MDRHRAPGLASLTPRGLQTHHYTTHGQALRSRHAQSLSTQLSVFQSLVHNFATTHSREIRADPIFRTEFARMCSALGIDFLASSYAFQKGGEGGGGGGGGGEDEVDEGDIKGQSSSLTTLLANPNTQTTTTDASTINLSLLIVEICRSTRLENGGFISISHLQSLLRTPRGPNPGLHVSASQIHRAVSSLAPLGSGFGIVRVGHGCLIRSVPRELNTDQSTVLEAVQVLGYVTVSMLRVNLGWEGMRVRAVLDDCLVGALVWVDCQAGENEYWSPAFIAGVGGVGAL